MDEDNDDIILIETEEQIGQDLDKNFKLRREFEQKAFYMDNGAQNYYDLGQQSSSHLRKSFSLDNNYDLLKKNFLKKNKKLAFISLGCGNAIGEYDLLKKACQDGFDLDYFGVDSSYDMLEFAKEKLSDISFKKKFICSDFSTDKFRDYIRDISLDYDVKLFFFFGNTFGNVPQSYMADNLRNLLDKDDLLWLNVSVREENSNNDASKFFQRYLGYLKDQNWIKFCTLPLRNKDFPLENGELTLKMDKETTPDLLKFKFGYLIRENTQITLEEEKVMLTQNDLIDLIVIRIYDIDSLINFFNIRDFKHMDLINTGTNAHFIFAKLK